jgi:hypothetical protein
MKELKAIKPIITQPYQPICSIKILINEPSSHGQVVSTPYWLKLNHCKDSSCAIFWIKLFQIKLSYFWKSTINHLLSIGVVYEDNLAYKIQLHHGLRLNKVLSAGRDKVLLTKYKFVTNTYYLLSSLTIFND